MKLKSKKNNWLAMPTALTIVFFIILICIIMSWVLHALDLKTLVTNKDGTKELERIKALGFFDWFYAPIAGFVKQAGLLIFVITIGAFIFLVFQSGTLEAFSQRINEKFKKNNIVLIPIFMLFFSLLGTVETFGEEKIPLYAVIVPIFLLAGFDKMTGFLVLMVGAGIGCMGTTISPFVVNIAFQHVAKGVFPNGQYPYSNGLIWRIVGYVVFTTVAIIYVTMYAYRVKKRASFSVTFQTLTEDKKFFINNQGEEVPLTKARIATLYIFFITLILMVLYLINWDAIFHITAFKNAGDWVNQRAPYLTRFIPGIGHGELDSTAVLFVISAIIVGIINRYSEPKFIKHYLKGAGNICAIGLTIATATGIGIVLQASFINNLIINSLVPITKGLNTGLTMIIIFLFSLPLSFLIPSTSGMIIAVFPIISPIVGANGVSGAIDATAWANGLINLVAPSSFILMTALQVARTDYTKLIKVIWPLILILTALSVLLLYTGSLLKTPIF